MEPIIVTRNLCKVYRTGGEEIHAVRDVGLEVKRGEFLSIVGHSGCGKTTLLSLIGGLIKPTRGRVFIEGVDIWSLGEDGLSAIRNKKIGFIFQFASLIPTLNAIENVMLPATFSREYEGDLLNRAKELLRLVGLSHRTDSYPSQLSGGEHRRVAIARALINNPDIILADEPTGDLDEETEAEVMELFLRINKEFGTTFLLVTHNSGLAKQTDRTLVMKQGAISH
jgi:ABC-type lipoprotein export system ATPase subunit